MSINVGMELPFQNTPIVWRPDPARAATSNLAGFMRSLGLGLADARGYLQLLERAEKDPGEFWHQVIRHAELKFYAPYKQILDTSRGIEWAQWCVGGTTNAVLNCLDRHTAPAQRAKDAIVWEAESGEKKRWSYAELSAQTSRLAEGLRSLGCGPGDVIGVCLPMVPEAAAALLAIVKIGAIVLPLYSGFGASAIASRLTDGQAVAVITADGTWRRGKDIPLKRTMDEAVASVATLKHVIVLRNTESPVQWDETRDHWWHALCADRRDDAPNAVMPADAPMMLMYTSGTTGKPKGTVHTHIGFITKMALDLGLCADLGADDRMMWMSDMGWLVGPMLIYGVTLAGATIVMAEGVHDYPDAGRFWRLIEENGLSFLGIAPTLIRSFMQVGGAGVEQANLSCLRVVLSSGEAWTPVPWTWLFETVCAKKIPIINYSGGTEIGGGIVTGTVIHPMKACAFSGPIPGMGADVVDLSGRPTPRGEVGELVLRQPSIGLTRSLWNDEARYLESYWQKIPGVWCQGDRALIDQDGYWFVLGRSDDTLKIAGKRTGPSEVEALVTQTGLAGEAVAVGVPDDIKGEALVLVVTLLAGVKADAATKATLSQAVVSGLGVAFRPRSIYFVADVPKTRNMKIMRRVVRAMLVGEAPGDLSSLANPESVEQLVAAIQPSGARS